MTIRARNRILMGGGIIGILALAATLLPMIASSGSDDVREIRLVVRNMSFYVEGQMEPNPTLTVRAGEQVRLVLRNEEPGMRHDFAVGAWAIRTRMLADRGEADTVTFRVPAERGEQTYQCTPHAKMMHGTIRVE
jgi:plastocyanin